MFYPLFMYDIIIAGSGPAGLTAAIYSCRANKRVLVLQGIHPGGQLTKTKNIENFPGLDQPVLGSELIVKMFNQVKNLNGEIIDENLLDFEKKDKSILVKTNKTIVETKSLIIAMGASPKLLGIEDKFLNKGISTCATCDGYFFKNKNVCVIGGGNTALEESLYLSNIVKQIFLIHRREKFKGDFILQKRVQEKKNITFLMPYEVVEFNGDINLEEITIRNCSDKKQIKLKVEGCFIAIGYIPNTNHLKNKLQLTKEGFVKNFVNTEIPGIFVAGDIHDYKYKQAITASGYGCMAAIESLKYLETL